MMADIGVDYARLKSDCLLVVLQIWCAICYGGFGVVVLGVTELFPFGTNEDNFQMSQKLFGR